MNDHVNNTYTSAFFIVPSYIPYLSGMTLNFLKVYETIFQFWNKKKNCFLSNSAIVERTGVQITQVKEALNFFEKYNELIRIQKGLKRFIAQPLKHIETDPEAAPPASCIKNTQEAAPPAGGGRSSGLDQAAPPATEIKNLNKELKKENPPISRKRDCVGEDDLKLTPREKGTNPQAMGTNLRALGLNPRNMGMFDSFWELYPSKKAKKKCMEIWKRRKLDSIAPLILDNLRKQVDGDDTWKRGFVPNPSTYLNQDRWEDEISQPKPDLRQEELERKKLAYEKRLVDQERISEQTRKYENEKFKEMNKDGKAFRELSKAVSRGDKKPPAEFSALKQSLLK